MIDAISHVTVGVADMRPVEDLWIDRFGLEIVDRRTGPDPGLGKLWDIAPDLIAEQLMLRTPGAATGWLHFVQFNNPDPPVRDGAAATDLGPKSIDVLCEDMPSRYSEMQAAGYRFRSEVGEYEVDDIRAREAQMPGHDDTNIVLIEILSGGFDIEYSPAGYGAVMSFVVIVPETQPEAKFYSTIFGLDEIMHHRITGPGIEAAVGLPKGAALDMRLMGRENHIFGRMELISYEAISGADRFASAKPPATGALHVGYAAESISDFVSEARESGYVVTAVQDIESIFGAGPMTYLRSPAGLRIDVFQKEARP